MGLFPEKRWIVVWIRSERFGYSVTPMQPGMGFPGIGNDRLRSYQPFMPSLHTFRVGGTGLSGLAFSNDLEGAFFGKYNDAARSEEHTSELQSRGHLVCRLLLEKKNNRHTPYL